MKKLILVLAIVGLSAHVHAQEVKASNVPVAVTTAFNQAHQTVREVEWSLKDGNNYEAAYEDGKVNTYVKYDASGNLIDTKVQIPGSDLPAPVLSYVKQNYKEDEVKKAYKITDASGTVTYRANACP